MFTIQSDFNNQYGFNIKGFTLVITDITFTNSSYINRQFVAGSYHESTNTNSHIVYRVDSYANAEMAESNISPLVLVLPGYAEYLTINDPEVPEGVLIEDYCKAHFLGLIDAILVSNGAVPFSVTRRQARQQLVIMGLLDQVPLIIETVEDPTQKEMIKIFWEDSTAFERNNPYLIMLGTALGLSAVDLDNAFINAKKL